MFFSNDGFLILVQILCILGLFDNKKGLKTAIVLRSHWLVFGVYPQSTFVSSYVLPVLPLHEVQYALIAYVHHIFSRVIKKCDPCVLYAIFSLIRGAMCKSLLGSHEARNQKAEISEEKIFSCNP